MLYKNYRILKQTYIRNKIDKIMKNNNIHSKRTWHSDYLAVQEILDGNMQTWDRLYRNTYPIVYNYVKRIHAGWHISYDQINDVTNEAFKRCFINLDTFLGNSKFSTWVCGFCRYILLSYYHKFRMQNKYAYDIYNKSQTYHESKNPEIYVIQKERNQCLWSAFNSLSPLHQLLLRTYILNETKPSQLNKIIKLLPSERTEELDIAIQTLRNRFLALYENKPYTIISAKET